MTTTTRRIEIPKQRLDQALHHAGHEWPHEAVGAIIGPPLDYWAPLRNTHDNPRAAYRCDPHQWLALCAHLDETDPWPQLVLYHSHPTGTTILSTLDIANALDPEVYHLVIGVARREITGYQIWQVELGQPHPVGLAVT